MSNTGAYAGNLSVFSIASASQLDYLQNANLNLTEQQQEGSSIAYLGGNTQGVKMGGELSCSLFSDQSTAIRVSHLDVSAADLGSVDLLSPNILYGLDLSLDYTHGMNPGIGELWQFPVIADRRFSGSLRLAMMTDDAPDLLVDLLSGTYADKNKLFSFTINGVEFEVPMRMTGATIPIQKEGMLEYTIPLADRSGRSGVTVKPTGTTSLIEKAFNSASTALAFAFRPKVHPSLNFAGNMLIKSFRMSIQDASLVPVNLTYACQGTWTGTATVS